MITSTWWKCQCTRSNRIIISNLPSVSILIHSEGNELLMICCSTFQWAGFYGGTVGMYVGVFWMVGGCVCRGVCKSEWVGGWGSG